MAVSLNKPSTREYTPEHIMTEDEASSVYSKPQGIPAVSLGKTSIEDTERPVIAVNREVVQSNIFETMEHNDIAVPKKSSVPQNGMGKGVIMNGSANHSDNTSQSNPVILTVSGILVAICGMFMPCIIKALVSLAGEPVSDYAASLRNVILIITPILAGVSMLIGVVFMVRGVWRLLFGGIKKL